MLFHAQITSEVIDTQDAECGIHRKAHQRRAGALELALQQVVRENDGGAEIGQEIGDIGLKWVCDVFSVNVGDRFQDSLVQREVEFQHCAVERLIGVVGLIVSCNCSFIICRWRRRAAHCEQSYTGNGCYQAGGPPGDKPSYFHNTPRPSSTLLTKHVISKACPAFGPDTKTILE